VSTKNRKPEWPGVGVSKVGGKFRRTEVFDVSPPIQ
jgi:hypothetical protein